MNYLTLKMEPSIPAHEYAFLQDPDAVDLKSTHLFLKRNFRSWFWIASVCIGFGFVCGVIVQDVSHLHLQYPRPKLTCSEPITRREWRSLSQHEKLEYIAAVQCLSTLPSSLGLNQTLHHDFPYIHSLFGNYCKFGRHPSEWSRLTKFCSSRYSRFSPLA